ncbi:MAG: hypothetical protein JWM69_1624 [Candidatus Binatus sp.]|nr:hypothetical protein [Candidatus Binatus sp.]
MNEITRLSSNTPWEPIVGYSRLVRVGDLVAVSGTTATDERGLIVGAGQMYVQARQALSNIQNALARIGLTMTQVVRTRMFVTDISRFADAARAHREFFADSPPATSMVEVRRLVNPEMLIEIEADAYAGGAASAPAAAEPTPVHETIPAPRDHVMASKARTTPMPSKTAKQKEASLKPAKSRSSLKPKASKAPTKKKSSSQKPPGKRR